MRTFPALALAFALPTLALGCRTRTRTPVLSADTGKNYVFVTYSEKAHFVTVHLNNVHNHVAAWCYLNGVTETSGRAFDRASADSIVSETGGKALIGGGFTEHPDEVLAQLNLLSEKELAQWIRGCPVQAASPKAAPPK